MSENTIRDGSTPPEKPVESNSSQKLRDDTKMAFIPLLPNSTIAYRMNGRYHVIVPPRSRYRGFLR